MINYFFILRYPESSVSSAKPFKSKNRDNVALDGSNKNLKKVMIQIPTRQPTKVPGSFLEVSVLQTHIIDYRLGCCMRICIITFFRFGFELSRATLPRFFHFNAFKLTIYY